jgi:hypothetical protein
MQGVDWTRVREIIDCTAELRELVAPPGSDDFFTLETVDSSGLLNLATSPRPTSDDPDTQRYCFERLCHGAPDLERVQCLQYDAVSMTRHLYH